MAKYASEDFQCIVTGKYGADKHHIITKKSGGSDDPCNLMPLKHALHQEAGLIGMTKFARKYPKAKLWLLEYGWEFDETRQKWVPPFDARLRTTKIKFA